MYIVMLIRANKIFQRNMYTLMNENSFFKQNFSSSVKTTISILIMAQTAMASAFTSILYKTKKNFNDYAVRREKISMARSFLI